MSGLETDAAQYATTLLRRTRAHAQRFIGRYWWATLRFCPPYQAGDAEYPARWKSIKSHFVRCLAKSGQSIPKRKDGSALLWQRRYWEHTVRDEQDFRQHVDYIHFNPVKHGCAMRPADWPYASFHRYVRQGVLAPT